MQYIDENIDIEGKVVLVRAGFNVPLLNGKVIDDFRIRQSIPTLSFLRDKGAKVIVIAHIGRNGEDSLREVVAHLATFIPATFFNSIDSAAAHIQNGEIRVVENLRADPREVENDTVFAKELAEYADIFVQDAFEACHREHASIVSIPKYIQSYGGLLLKKEITELSGALQPEHPALFILGGGKINTKEPLLLKFLSLYDTTLIGGILQNEIIAAHGLEIGKSVVEDRAVPFDILTTEKDFEILDVLVERNDTGTAYVPIQEIQPTDTIVDMGIETIKSLITTMGSYKTILWNGPLGWYEKGYDAATILLARAVANSGATTILGGGDTVAVVEQEGLIEKFTFVSTGGGAMLQFLQNGTLVGIKALEEKPQ